MKILMFGLGRQGERILDLLCGDGFDNIWLYDINSGLLEKLSKKYQKKTSVFSENFFALSDEEKLSQINNFDLIIDSLPAAFSYDLFKVVAKTNKKMVSVSFLEEDFMAFHDEAHENGALIIPDCGAAPGFSHLLSGYSVVKLDGADSIEMKLGAIPLEAKAPFYHSITWAIEDLLEEYLRPAKIRINGEIKVLDPFDTIENENLFGLLLESFLTDGVRSFLATYPHVKNVTERTLRHKGHLQFMQSLKDLGLISRKALIINEKEIVPIKVLNELINQNFLDLPKEDQFIMEIVGKKGDKELVHKYKIGYDHENNVSALVNSVAITAFCAAKLIAENKINETGVMPLENLCHDEIYNEMIKAHESVGALVEVARCSMLDA
ncbi:MAG: saccharopine dehydrogenase C-terminal domain-containing protein [Pseudomonadota bacterium]